ncbi:hypothetical protein HQ489_00795 [Candidatus Woesearchaeota archaeon]|nr:hypothetical protein [Candidatus Woesearchaeota archaeon]
MEIKDLQANQGKVDLVVEVVELKEARTFEKFGKSGKVCNAIVKDATGTVTLTLWNEDVDKVKQGARIHIKNGWCSEYRDEKQVSSGKFGEIEVLASTLGGQQPGEMLTNSPEMLAGRPLEGLEEDSEDEDPLDMEEMVE